MKKKFTSFVIGSAMLIFASNSTMAASNAPAIEEDMAEGISYAVQQEKKTYAYDNSIVSPEQNLSEYAVDSKGERKREKLHYGCDPSAPSAESLMAEGICYEESEPLVATK